MGRVTKKNLGAVVARDCYARHAEVLLPIKETNLKTGPPFLHENQRKALRPGERGTWLDGYYYDRISRKRFRYLNYLPKTELVNRCSS